MKTFLRLVILTSVVALAVGLASAQTCSEPMQGKIRDMTANDFGCPGIPNTGSAPCGISYRYYSDDPASTGGVNPGADGNPIWSTSGTGSYHADVLSSQNIFGGAAHPCGKNVYLVWDHQAGEGTGDHAGYYAAQSQVVEPAETGNTIADCGGSAAVSCFAAIRGLEALANPSTPQGTLNPIGGLSAVPVPTVSASTDTTVTLSWVAATNWHPTPAAGGDPGTAPSPITGVNVYLYESPGVIDSRSVTDADLAGATFLRFVAAGTTSTIVDFATDVTGGTGTFIPVTKVAYRDDTTLGAIESVYFSANGPVVRVNDALFTQVVDFRVDFMGKVRGETGTHVSWATVAEDGLDGFELYRSTTSLDGPWVMVGDFMLPNGSAGEGSVYGVDDSFKAKGAKSVWYKVVIHDSGRAPRDHGPVMTSIFK